MTDGVVDEWLSLSEASDLLGVHPSTLRRWADGGRVPAQRTPGGHRRFSRRRLQGYLDQAPGPPDRTAVAGAPGDQSWYDPFAAADLIEASRELGQRLSGLLFQYVMRPEADPRYLDEGHALGAMYGHHSLAGGISLADAVRAFLFFRTSLMDMVPTTPGHDGSNALRLYARYDQFMNEVLLGLITPFDQPSMAPLLTP